MPEKNINDVLFATYKNTMIWLWLASVLYMIKKTSGSCGGRLNLHSWSVTKTDFESKILTLQDLHSRATEVFNKPFSLFPKQCPTGSF